MLSLLMAMKFAILLASLCGILGVPIQDDPSLEFLKGNHKFTEAVYKELLKNEKANFLFSPLSAEIALALTNEGARGETSEELVRGVSLPSIKENTQKAIRNILPNLKRSDDVKLQTANIIYVANDVKLKEDFRTVATTVYESGLDTVNFAKNKEAAGIINNWVENRTDHKIKNLIDPEDLDGDTKMALVNALYFSAEWVSQFTYTAKDKFFINKNNSVDVNTMHRTGYFSYYENPNLKAKFLELPYKGCNVTMVIILPNETEGLKELEQNIENLLVHQPLTSTFITLKLPRFTTETSIKFIPILKNLGVKKLFDDADLTGLSSNYQELYVKQVVQKAFINVTETGTEAAAATAVIIYTRRLVQYVTPPLIVHVDHPFLYYIKLNDVVLFFGRYVNP